MKNLKRVLWLLTAMYGVLLISEAQQDKMLNEHEDKIDSLKSTVDNILDTLEENEIIQRV